MHVSLPLLGLFRGGGRGGLYVRVQGGREGGVGAWVGRLTMAKKTPAFASHGLRLLRMMHLVIAVLVEW